MVWPENWGVYRDRASSAESSGSVLPPLAPELVNRLVSTYKPLADWLAVRASRQAVPLMLGINGAQGTGKSTAAAVLAALLAREHKCRVVTLSIDDLYLPRAARQRLAAEVHPLLSTRGVPGTHDLPLAQQLLDKLCTATAASRTAIVRFNKADDDRVPEADYDQFTGRPDVILLEGWCVGAQPEPEQALRQACNRLEAEQDADGRWRRYVNRCLSDYQALFARLDVLVMLQAPSFERVYAWRELQEQKLRDSLTPEALVQSRVMTPAQVQHFISHYERLTRWMLAEMPARADLVFALDDDHRIGRVHVKPGLSED